MKHLVYLERYQRIEKLIRNENTGNATDFATKIGLSRRMLFNYLDDLRDAGLEIEYSRKRITYYLLSKNNVINLNN